MNKIRKYILEQNYGTFPESALVKTAKWFSNFRDFEKHYTVDINHGYYWHLTDDLHFKPSTNKGPRDMSSLASGKPRIGAVMITSDLDYWDEHYNEPEITRPFAALLDASDIEPKYLKQVSRGFGNEIFLESSELKKLKVIKVYPISMARYVDTQLSRQVPQSREELEKVFNISKNGEENNSEE